MKSMKFLFLGLFALFLANCGPTLKSYVKDNSSKPLSIAVLYSETTPRTEGHLTVSSNAFAEDYNRAGTTIENSYQRAGNFEQNGYNFKKDLTRTFNYPTEYDGILTDVQNRFKELFSGAKVDAILNNAALPKEKAFLGIPEIDWEKTKYDMIIVFYPTWYYNVKLTHPDFECYKSSGGKSYKGTCYNVSEVKSYGYIGSIDYNYRIYTRNDKGKIMLSQDKQWGGLGMSKTAEKMAAMPLDEILKEIDVHLFTDTVRKAVINNLNSKL